LHQKNILEKLEQKRELLDPKEILKRGYSITYYQGNTLTDAAKVDKGETIVTRLFRGEIKSEIKEKD
jgi:exodeoxyribonuclease VII large subunit